MKRLLVAGGIAAAGIVLLVSLGLLGAFEPADAFVDRWLHAVTGDGPADRGWSQMDESSRQRFGNDAEAFRAAAAAQDWSAFRWELESSHQLESSLWWVYITVEGGLADTPGFLRDNRLVAPWCLDDTAPGIGLSVVQEWPFGQRIVGPGGLTGSSELALTTGACAATPSEEQQFQPGVEIVWAGHRLEVWNWTGLPLFIIDDDGHRADLPACQKVGTDDMARQFEIRAATGYIATVGLETPLPGVTTYIVIGSRDLYVNNAPPLGPMPPCEGRPQVQPGV